MSNDIRKRLRCYIKDKMFIQAEIARRSNITPQQLSAILRGKRKMDANELYRICEALGTTIDEITHYSSQRG